MTTNKFDNNTLRGIWENEMDILDVIDRVCRENDIKYSIAYGSMLGAVRHKGFIPWDDDMDIWMLREDYERFIEVWERSNIKGYYLLSQEKVPLFTQDFIKIRKDNTAFVSAGEEHLNFHHGIFVDIFAMDNVCNSKWGARWQSYCALLKMLYLRGYAPQRDGKLMYWGGKLLLDFMPKTFQKKLKEFFYKQTMKYNRPDYPAKRVATFVTSHDAFVYYDKSLLLQWQDICFEDRKYMCNKDTDTLLRTYYGDYMQLPPEGERTWKHYPSIVDFENEHWPTEDHQL